MTEKLTIRPIGQMVAALSRYGQQLYQPPSETIRGVEPDTWYSPLQPIKPIGPAGVEPRGFQYWAGQNLLWTPRSDAPLSAADLKTLACYPLARVAIENVKDSMIKASWQIQPRPEQGESRKAAYKRGMGDAKLLALNKFFECPDREHMWPEWLRPLLDDMLVIDAWTILIRRTYGGEIVELPVIRGDSIVRYIDENGFTPMPPEPAYAQNWWGIPLVNLTTDQLVYKPRNIVPRNTIASQLYGMSPTEQLAPEIQIGIKRLEFTLAYYTEGSTPGVVQVVPRGTTTDQISASMQWMNSELAGNLAARRQWRLIQGYNEPGKDDQIIFTKEPLLADIFDDMHIRKIAFGYGISPQRLMKMIRTEGQASQEAADVEGLLPYFASLKSLMDYIIQRKFGYESYEMVLEPLVEPDPVKQSTVICAYVKEGIITRNEGRERIGEDKASEPEADMLTVTTGQGAVPLGMQLALPPKPGEEGKEGEEGKNVPGAKPNGKGSESAAGGEGESGDEGGERGKPRSAAPRKPASANKANGSGAAGEARAQATTPQIGFVPGGAPPAGDYVLGSEIVSEGSAVRKAAKVPRRRIAIYPGRLAPQSILARVDFEKTLRKRFQMMRRKTTKAILAALELPHEHIQKSAESDAVREILDALVKDWKAIGESAEKNFTAAAEAGAGVGGLQLSITSEDMLASINTVAGEWAEERAAELVGMRVTSSGRVIPNPRAAFAITQTTRDKLREVIADLFNEEKATLRDVEEAIQEAGIFSDTRATMIARTEISRAQTQGNLLSWQVSGIVEQVAWQLSADHDKDDICDQLAGDGPYPIDQVPDLPAHPNCECALVLIEAGSAEEGEE